MARTKLPPEKKRKDDSSRNPEGMEEAIARHMKKERRVYPMKINATTYIYVPKRKQTPEYAAKYREKAGLSD